jgi:hypothetical protein
MEEGKDFLTEEIDKLSAREAYWRAKYEKTEEERMELLELLRSQLWNASTDKLLKGSIGAGSTVLYGADSKIIGTAIGAGGIVFGIASLFLPVSLIGTAVSFTIGIMGDYHSFG